ncbi:MAG: hypothetical protein VCD31_14730 [Alphaproteobacteria bacterium]
MFDQAAADAKIAMRRVHRDGAEEKRRPRARDGERPVSNCAHDDTALLGDKAKLGDRVNAVA